MKYDSRILVIDDDETCNFKLSTLLKKHFKEVYSAFDGKEGWQMYLNYLPDTVITDLNMPELNGTELVQKIRRIDDQCVIVLMTAFSDEQQIETIGNLRINQYFVKPMTSIKISHLINNIRSMRKKFHKQRIPINDVCWYDTLSKSVKSENMYISLSNREIMVIEFFLEHPNEIVTYEMLDYALADSESTSFNAIKIIISRIRKKVPSIGIETIYKIGYLFRQ